MKKILLTLSVLGIAFAHAQQGINTEKAGATLDIKASKTDGTTKEGLLIPRMDKTAVSKIAQPEISTLIFVNEVTNYTKGTDTNADTRVEFVDSVGFYHYNGTHWVKHLDTNTNEDEWAYDTNDKRVNLRRSGSTMSDSYIFYNRNGAYINTNMLTGSTTAFDINTNSIISRPADSFDELYNDVHSKKITTKTYLPYFDDRQLYSLSLKGSSMYVEDTQHSNNDKVNLLSASASIRVSPSNTKNYNQLMGSYSAVYFDGKGDGKYTIGGYFDGRLNRGKSTGYVVGGRVTASYATNESSNQQIGSQIFNQVLKTGEGIITKMSDIATNTAFQNDKTINVTEMRSLELFRTFENKGAVNITTAIGIDYAGINTDALNNVTVQNNYGLRINDVLGGKVFNYAIYTNKGKVHIGDELEVKSTIKVADNENDKECNNSQKAGTIRFNSETKKFQGCTGTNWVDLH